MGETEYIIAPRPPIKGMLLAAVVSILGALILAVALAKAWNPAISILGGVLLSLGVVMAMVGLVSTQTRQARLIFTPRGFELVTPNGSRMGQWDRVTRVTRSRDGRKITITEGNHQRTQMLFSHSSEQQIRAIIDDMSQRLDIAKGYTRYRG